MPDGYGGGHIMEGESNLAKRWRGYLNIRRKVEQHTLPQYRAKAVVMVIIFKIHNALKDVSVTSDVHVCWTDGSRFDDGRV
jgi:hypothetical protein